MNFMPSRCFIITSLLFLGCANDPQPSAAEGNDALGITSFQSREDATKTTVVGLDADGYEVARLELVHGRFELTGAFQADYDTKDVVGRKLDVDVKGQKLVYETAGFDPVLRLPAHPASKQAIAAFLDDPHVKPVLDRWQLGFQHASPSVQGETPYEIWWNYQSTGIVPASCAGVTSCNVDGLSIGTCGGSAVPSAAQRVYQPAGWVYPGSTGQYIVDQCCPPITGIPTNWFGHKECPTPLTRPADTATCGTASAACKGCPFYDAESACYQFLSDANWAISGGPYNGQEVYTVSTNGGSTCFDGGLSCSANTDCCSYACYNHVCLD